MLQTFVQHQYRFGDALSLLWICANIFLWNSFFGFYHNFFFIVHDAFRNVDLQTSRIIIIFVLFNLDLIFFVMDGWVY